MSEFDLNIEKQNPTQIQLETHIQNIEQLLDTYDRYMYLKLYIDDTNDLKNRYIDAALNHNNKILNSNNLFLDAGFDLFNPSRKVFYSNQMSSVNKIDHNVICSAQMVNSFNKVYNTGYYMYPRSSISKTKLRLANATGIIDAGYRGHLMGMFDLINLSDNEEYVVEKHDRLLQICAPGLIPILVEVVNQINELGCETQRGTGGFGSSGR
jgi:dUTPase